jgi:hypothetical protein
MARKIKNSAGMIRDEAREAAMTWADVVERVTRIELALSLGSGTVTAARDADLQTQAVGSARD